MRSIEGCLRGLLVASRLAGWLLDREHVDREDVDPDPQPEVVGISVVVSENPPCPLA